MQVASLSRWPLSAGLIWLGLYYAHMYMSPYSGSLRRSFDGNIASLWVFFFYSTLIKHSGKFFCSLGQNLSGLVTFEIFIEGLLGKPVAREGDGILSNYMNKLPDLIMHANCNIGGA